jgi:hypothetical protein
MLWFIIHHSLKKMTPMENQKRNLITFSAGLLSYILFYSYVFSFDCIDHPLLFGYFFCIVMADILAIYTCKRAIFKEANTFLKETVELQNTATDVEPNNFNSNEELTNESIPLLKNESDYIDENEGFVKDSALGNAYNTNCNSNA